jgi:hypothetical protein
MNYCLSATYKVFTRGTTSFLATCLGIIPDRRTLLVRDWRDNAEYEVSMQNVTTLDDPCRGDCRGNGGRCPYDPVCNN